MVDHKGILWFTSERRGQDVAQQGQHIEVNPYSDLCIEGPDSRDKLVVNLASGQTIYLDKLYGPSAFMDLRITADTKRYAWVVEQCEEDLKTMEQRWVERAVIPAWPVDAWPVEEK